MLRMTIDTVEPDTGKELPIPSELRARVQRAADILAILIRKVGESFDIEARWWFLPGIGNEFELMLGFSTSGRTTSYRFPMGDLQDDESIRRRLWTPIGFLIPVLSEDVDHELEKVRHGRQALVTTAEE